VTNPATSILRGAEGLLTAVAMSRLPQPWGLIFSSMGAAAGFAADLVEAGLDPTTAITELRSAVPEFAAANGRLNEYIAARTAEAARREKP
jgi:hypothetical protein